MHISYAIKLLRDYANDLHSVALIRELSPQSIKNLPTPREFPMSGWHSHKSHSNPAVDRQWTRDSVSPSVAVSLVVNGTVSYLITMCLRAWISIWLIRGVTCTVCSSKRSVLFCQINRNTR